jgi:hypothetical protein
MLKYLEPGSEGPWKVEHFELSAKDVLFFNLRAAIGNERGRVDPGTYTRLVHRERGTVMSDTPVELLDLQLFKSAIAHFSEGDIHINGLGLGVCAEMALKTGRHVTVVEIDPYIIKLVGTQLQAKYENLEIICADAVEYKPPRKMHAVVWHDIWDNICEDNLSSYHKLHRRWQHWTHWQSSWGYEEVRYGRRGRRY